MIGGDRYKSIIAKFENDEWSLYGNLYKRRLYQGSIASGSLSMVIGGSTNDGS